MANVAHRRKRIRAAKESIDAVCAEEGTRKVSVWPRPELRASMVLMALPKWKS